MENEKDLEQALPNAEDSSAKLAATETTAETVAVALEEDFSGLPLSELLKNANQLHESVKQSESVDFKKTDRTLQKLKEAVDAHNRSEREAALDKFKTANEGNSEGFDFKRSVEVESFYEIFKDIKDRKSKHIKKLESDKQQNLSKKSSILEQIKALTEKMDGPDASDESNKKDMESYKALLQEWKATGSVPQESADELNKRYRALTDQFHSRKKLDNEAREFDRKRNLDAKLKICEKAEELSKLDNVNEAVRQLNILHQEFKKFGPVPKDRQEEIWSRFKVASDVVYNHKKASSEDFKKTLEDNMKLKQELCLEIEKYADFQTDRMKEWNIKTKEVLAIQERWDKVGAAPKEVSKSLNKQFWKDLKSFFQNKTKFYEGMSAERNANLAQKVAICEQVEALKGSFNWDEDSDKIKDLQNEWKKIGPVPDNQNEAIYERFKNACDQFFARKRNRHQEQDKAQEHNLAQKEALCKQMEDLVKNNGLITLEVLEQFHVKWHESGQVPKKNMDSISGRFEDASDALLRKFGTTEEEYIKARTELQERLVQTNPKYAFKFRKREGNIKRRITALENDINLWQNNIEFFASSKTADKLRSEFNAKISDAKKELAVLQKELRMLSAASAAEAK
ncbi:MAG: DUF349 domain-containing protein [Cytophagales bacterium]|nr:MAG: DUF349 domain-containing protein [Cytophagales bacterium]TAF61153.1 MAG: DUF349 domain-containing protein [Cytophagales bacterium]